MNKPIQYLLVGYPYSGKTTLAKRLEKEFGFARINIDELKWDAGFKDMGDDAVPDEVWEKIFKKADSLLVKYLRQGKNVANEYAWITKTWRERARNVAKKAGFDTRVIYLKTPKKEIEKRWLTNLKTKSRFHWPESEFKRVFFEFEEPTPEENTVSYSPKTPLSAIIVL